MTDISTKYTIHYFFYPVVKTTKKLIFCYFSLVFLMNTSQAQLQGYLVTHNCGETKVYSEIFEQWYTLMLNTYWITNDLICSLAKKNLVFTRTPSHKVMRTFIRVFSIVLLYAIYLKKMQSVPLTKLNKCCIGSGMLCKLYWTKKQKNILFWWKVAKVYLWKYITYKSLPMKAGWFVMVVTENIE